MRLDAEVVRYMSKEEFRVLTAVEMGHKNHEFVPVPLVESIASLKRRSIRGVLATLCKNKLLYRTNQKYEGFKLTYLGYDFLALHALVKRGLISGVGGRMGVGKESDIHLCEDSEGKILVLKLHRLGTPQSQCPGAHFPFFRVTPLHTAFFTRHLPPPAYGHSRMQTACNILLHGRLMHILQTS